MGGNSHVNNILTLIMLSSNVLYRSLISVMIFSFVVEKDIYLYIPDLTNLWMCVHLSTLLRDVLVP